MVVSVMLLLSTDALHKCRLNIRFNVNSIFALLVFLRACIIFKVLKFIECHTFIHFSFTHWQHLLTQRSPSQDSQDHSGPHHSAQLILLMATWRKNHLDSGHPSKCSQEQQKMKKKMTKEERKGYKGMTLSAKSHKYIQVLRRQRWPGNAWGVTIFKIILNNKPLTF